MTLEISTPALLFPAVSVLFLSDTHRFPQMPKDWRAVLFFAAVVLMSLSLTSLVIEVMTSGGALKILLGRMEREVR